jgi:hypothetical protein
MVFNSVGIFCASCINVFANDSAQLMFAHYAKNCRGIALIYQFTESPGNLHEMTYNDENLLKDQSNVAPYEWLDNNFSNVDSFKKKSTKWQYENEYRLFDTPGVHDTTEHKLELRAILYTSRLSNSYLKELAEINDNTYESNLKLQEIYPSRSEKHTGFLIDGKESDIVKWVRGFE